MGELKCEKELVFDVSKLNHTEQATFLKGIDKIVSKYGKTSDCDVTSPSDCKTIIIPEIKDLQGVMDFLNAHAEGQSK